MSGKKLQAGQMRSAMIAVGNALGFKNQCGLAGKRHLSEDECLLAYTGRKGGCKAWTRNGSYEKRVT